MVARLIVYAVIIIVVVAGALFWLTNEPQGRAPGRDSGTPPLKSTWKPSSQHDDEANADFRVASDRSDLPSSQGKPSDSNWPQFNGLHRDNRSSATGLMSAWPPEGPPLVWAAFGLGSGFSSVAVVDGVVYTMGNKGESEAIIALDAGSGEKIWSTSFAAASHPSNGDGPRGTPAVGSSGVYGLGAAGDLVCVDPRSGKILWQKNVLQEFGGRIPTWGVCESVLLDGNRLLVTPGGDQATFVALNSATGDLVWKSLLPERDGMAYSSATVADIGGIRQYVQFTASGTVGIRADNGQFLWRENTAANPTANCASPQASGDTIFSASNYGNGGALVRLTPVTSGIQAELVYHTRKMRNHHGDFVIVDGLLYGADDLVLTCLELATGDVKWQNRSVGKGAVTFADGRIYLRSEKGPVALVEATGDGYHELGQFDPPHRSPAAAWSHPVVAAGRLFLRDQGALLCYELTPTEN